MRRGSPRGGRRSALAPPRPAPPRAAGIVSSSAVADRRSRQRRAVIQRAPRREIVQKKTRILPPFFGARRPVEPARGAVFHLNTRRVRVPPRVSGSAGAVGFIDGHEVRAQLRHVDVCRRSVGHNTLAAHPHGVEGVAADAAHGAAEHEQPQRVGFGEEGQGLGGGPRENHMRNGIIKHFFDFFFARTVRSYRTKSARQPSLSSPPLPLRPTPSYPFLVASDITMSLGSSQSRYSLRSQGVVRQESLTSWEKPTVTVRGPTKPIPTHRVPSVCISAVSLSTSSCGELKGKKNEQKK